MSQNPMTKLWYMTLKSPTTISSQPFRHLWTEVLAFCNSASGLALSGHHLWQSLANPSVLVMLSGYPSQASNQAADKQYVESGFMARMAEFVEHGRLLQVERDVNSLPVDGQVLCVETLSSAQSGLDGEEVMEGFELGKGGVRERICLRFRGLKDEDVTQGEAERGDGNGFQTVYLRRIMG
jgi:hypothetical protein